MRYKVWRSRSDNELHLIFTLRTRRAYPSGEGEDAFEALPVRIRNLGPWAGSKEGDIDGLRLPYRVLLAEQGFVVVHCHVSKLRLEAKGSAPVEKNKDCPDCGGSGQVAMHGGPRQKECWRCRGRGWLPKR
jgi:ribosomal protein S27AE